MRPADRRRAARGAARTAERTPDPCVVVIFGASGDLTKRKLLPALYHLDQGGLLPKNFSVLGVARRPLEQSFAPDMKEGIIAGGGVEDNDPKLAPFVDRVQYYAMNFDDPAGYDGLKKKLSEMVAARQKKAEGVTPPEPKAVTKQR